MNVTRTPSTYLVQDNSGLWIQSSILPLSLMTEGNLPSASTSLCLIGKGEYGVSFAQVLGEVDGVPISHSSLHIGQVQYLVVIILPALVLTLA